MKLEQYLEERYTEAKKAHDSCIYDGTSLVWRAMYEGQRNAFAEILQALRNGEIEQ